jgi:hypothetical protein
MENKLESPKNSLLHITYIPQTQNILENHKKETK